MQDSHVRTILSIFFLAGSLFNFDVADLSQVHASGHGLGLVACKRPTSFDIVCSSGDIDQVSINITGKVLVVASTGLFIVSPQHFKNVGL